MVEEYCLVASKGLKDLADVKRVCGHPQIMDACSGFLNTLSSGDEVLSPPAATTTGRHHHWPPPLTSAPVVQPPPPPPPPPPPLLDGVVVGYEPSRPRHRQTQISAIRHTAKVVERVAAMNSASACANLKKELENGSADALATAAVAPREAAALHGLEVLAPGIANDSNAETRYLIIGRHKERLVELDATAWHADTPYYKVAEGACTCLYGLSTSTRTCRAALYRAMATTDLMIHA